MYSKMRLMCELSRMSILYHDYLYLLNKIKSLEDKGLVCLTPIQKEHFNRLYLCKITRITHILAVISLSSVR